jgi:hypothetical protein
MYDDIRVVVAVKHEQTESTDIDKKGRKSKPRRIKFLGENERSVRVRSIRNGAQLVVEGSFLGFLQGHNCAGSMDIKSIVREVVLNILKRMNIKPTTLEILKINRGDIKLERLDIVGFMRCNDMGGPSAIINALEAGLIGSRVKRFIAPNETLVYHMTSSYWSLMFYNKERQMRKAYPDTWKNLDSQIKDFTKHYIRIELRQFRKELEQHGITSVKDVSLRFMLDIFSKRLKQVFDDLNDSNIHFPVSEGALNKYELLARLYVAGTDFISTQPESTQRRTWKAIKERFGVRRDQIKSLPRSQQKRLNDFKQIGWHHGAPRKLVEAGLVHRFR